MTIILQEKYMFTRKLHNIDTRSDLPKSWSEKHLNEEEANVNDEK